MKNKLPLSRWGRRFRLPTAHRCHALLLALCLCAAACRQDMHDQPKYKPLHESDFFADHRSARPELEGVVARGQLKIDTARYAGKVNGNDVTTFPFQLTRADLARGQERFNIYCSPCHSRIGDGNGLVVKRGFRQPPSYHIQRLKDAPVGHFFDVISNGYGSMPSYASRVATDDRWRIIGYIRALQLAEGAAVNDVPEDQRNQIMPEAPAAPGSQMQPTNNPPANPASPPVGGTTPAQPNPGAKP